MALSWRRILRGRGLTCLTSIAFALCACATAQAPPGRKVIENVPDARSLDGRRAALPDGHYTCSIEDGGTRYPQFPCVVATTNGKVRLEKVGGSQRIRGDVTLTSNGFHFDGEFFCPFGDCLQAVSADFALADERHYVGEIHTSTGVVHFDLRYRPGGEHAYDESAFGGGAYGGAAYGGTGSVPVDLERR